MDLIGSREVAQILGISVPTVNRRAGAGELPAVHKIPGRRGAYVFDRATIEGLAADVDQADDEMRAAS
jgi:predicted DNA-binding transcriptional regulator AlpA